MHLSDYINESLTWVMPEVESRDDLLKQLSGQIAQVIDSVEADALCDALVAREHQGSTGTPEGIALPHAMIEGLEQSFVAAALVRKGVDFHCPTTPSVDLVFVLVGPKDKAWEHVRLLARLARVCHRPGALAYLRTAASGEDLHRRLVEEDQRHV